MVVMDEVDAGEFIETYLFLSSVSINLSYPIIFYSFYNIYIPETQNEGVSKRDTLIFYIYLCLTFLHSLVNLLVRLVAAHFADGVLEHGVLLEEVVDGFLARGVVVHGGFEEEGEEALCA